MHILHALKDLSILFVKSKLLGVLKLITKEVQVRRFLLVYNFVAPN